MELLVGLRPRALTVPPSAPPHSPPHTPPRPPDRRLPPTGYVRALAEAGAAVLVVEQRARAVLALSDYTYVLGGGQVLMANTPARLNASQEFTESFFGVGPKTPQSS